MFVNRSTSNSNDLVYNVSIRILPDGINLSFYSKYEVSDPEVVGDLYQFNVNHRNESGIRSYDYDLNAIDGTVSVEFLDGDKKRRRPRIIIHL